MYVLINHDKMHGGLWGKKLLLGPLRHPLYMAVSLFPQAPKNQPVLSSWNDKLINQLGNWQKIN